MVVIKGDGKVVKTDNKIKKTMGQKGYDNEIMVYKKRLSYTPKLISSDDNKNEIIISYECCIPFTKIPKREKEFYYPQIKKLFYRFKRDTGFYHGDFAPKNIIVNTKTKKVKLIDFEKLIKDFDDVKKERRRFSHIDNLLNDAGIQHS